MDLQAVAEQLPERVRGLGHKPWRAVEGQHFIATRPLVDSDAEQATLEALIDRHKPPQAPGTAHLHYLLATPFRHRPLRPHGSRFARATEAGCWYGTLRESTALAETAFYRLWFLEGSPSLEGPVRAQLTLFQAVVRTTRAVDLTAPAWCAEDAAIHSRAPGEAPQALGGLLRTQGVHAALYRSARDPAGGLCLVVFDPSAFAETEPRSLQSWALFATRQGVDFTRLDSAERRVHSYARQHFEVDGRLPSPPS